MPPCSHPSTLRHYKAISEATDLPFLIYAFNATLVPERDIRLVDLVVGEFPDNWSGFKILMKAVGIDCGPCRAPYAPLTKAEERQRLKAFASLHLS